MAPSTRGTVAKRASIPLTAQDLDALKAIVSSESARRLLEVDPGASEASLLHSIFELGLKQAFEELDERGYAELATDPERTAYTKAAQARRRG